MYNVKFDGEAKLLQQFEHDDLFDFWSKMFSLNSDVEVMVAPEAQGNFTSFLQMHNIKYSVFIDNLEW